MPEQVVQLVGDKEIEKLIANSTPVIEGELGRVFISRTWLPDDPNATISLDVQGFFGTKTIKASGLKKLALF